MRRKYGFAYIVVVLALLTNTTLLQGRTRQTKKARSSISTASKVVTTSKVTFATSAPVIGSSTAAKIAGKAVRSLNGLIDNITLAGGANITITPNGNTLTIDAPNILSSSVAHDETLTGDGSATTPLGLPVPLFFRGNVPKDQAGILVVTNAEPGGRSIVASGGASDIFTRGGIGLQAQGGDGNKNTGGAGLLGGGGIGVDHNGGPGGAFLGGAASNGNGGSGAILQGGPSTNNGSGGNGAILQGGGSIGAGHKSGNGLTAAPGGALDGAIKGVAGEFLGDVTISGNLSKGGGSFKIDHPLDPANKYLYHSFVESPDMKNIYDGVVTLDSNGEGVVTLPDWFSALNRDFRYLLTPIGAPAPNLFIAEKIAGNRFRIAGGQPGMEVSWQVTGIRQDAYANKNRIPVEEDKPETERGFFLHPAAFGQPEEKNVLVVQHPEIMRQIKEASEKARTQKNH